MNRKQILAISLLLSSSFALGMKREFDGSEAQEIKKKPKVMLSTEQQQQLNTQLISEFKKRVTTIPTSGTTSKVRPIRLYGWDANLEKINGLLKAGAEMNSELHNVPNTTPFLEACAAGDHIITKFLIDNGANLSGIKGEVALLRAATTQSNESVIQVLLAHQAKGSTLAKHTQELRKSGETFFSLFSPDLNKHFSEEYSLEYVIPTEVAKNLVENKKVPGTNHDLLSDKTKSFILKELEKRI